MHLAPLRARRSVDVAGTGGLGLGLALAQRLPPSPSSARAVAVEPGGQRLRLFFGDAGPAAKRRETTTRRLVGSLQR
jgi:hypothetical protein